MKKLLSRNAHKIIKIGMQNSVRDQNPNQLAGNFNTLSLFFKIQVYLAPILPYLFSNHILACISIIKHDKQALQIHGLTSKVARNSIFSKENTSNSLDSHLSSSFLLVLPSFFLLGSIILMFFLPIFSCSPNRGVHYICKTNLSQFSRSFFLAKYLVNKAPSVQTSCHTYLACAKHVSLLFLLSMAGPLMVKLTML